MFQPRESEDRFKARRFGNRHEFVVRHPRLPSTAILRAAGPFSQRVSRLHANVRIGCIHFSRVKALRTGDVNSRLFSSVSTGDAGRDKFIPDCLCADRKTTRSQWFALRTQLVILEFRPDLGNAAGRLIMVREISYIRARRGLCRPPVGWSVSSLLAVPLLSSVPSLPVFQSFYPRTGLRNMQWLILGRETALSEYSLFS